MLKLATSLLGLPPERVDHEVLTSLQDVCQAMNLDRASLWQCSDELPRIMLTHMHGMPADPPVAAQGHADALFPWAVEQVLRGETVAISDTQQLPPEAARDRESWRLYGTQSVLAIPLTDRDGRIAGALALSCVRERRDWPEKLIIQCRLLGQIFANVLARKHADELLRRSEERVRALVDSAPIAIGISRRGTTLYANKAFRELFGFPPDAELAGTPVTQCWTPAVRASIEERAYRRSQGLPTPTEYEARALRQDGTEFDAHVSAGVAELSDGKATIGFITDVSARKWAEAQLQLSRQRLALHIERTPLAAIEFDLEGRILEWNPAAETIFGFTKDEVVGQSWKILVPENLVEQLLRVWEGILTHPEGNRSSNLNRRKDGRIIRCEWFNTPLVGSDGRVMAVASLVMDVTEQKEAEDRLRESEAATRALIDAVDHGLALLTPEGSISIANHWAAASFRQTTDSLRGKSVFDLMPEDVRESRRQALARAASSPQSLRFNDRSGGRDFENRLYPVVTPSGHISHIAVAYRDITELKQSEQALLQAKADAEAANHAKDRFIALLSHELRTPLTPALAAASVLAKDARLPADARHDLDMVVRSIAAESRLIDDLLDITHVATGKLLLRQEIVDAAGVLREVIRVCGPEADTKRVRMNLQMPPVAYPMLADAKRLHQVFRNLLRNAIKFVAADGTVLVRASTHLRPDGAWLNVSITDNGIGLEAEMVERIFSPFEQGQRLLQNACGGLGLGLSISKALVEMHGGTVRAASDGPGKGSTFTVELPLVSSGPQRAAPSPAAPARQPAAPSLRILVVEDHPDTAKLLQRLLQARGHVVTTAGDLATGVAIATTGPFDLLVCDLGLPDGTGHDLMRALAAVGKAPPAIVLSGYNSDADIARSQAVGFLEHLSKPVEFPKLQEAIDRAMAKAFDGGARA
jgi:PAS domain S-box-containing protein